MTDQNHTPTTPTPSPTLIIGSILAMGVIRLLEHKKQLDSLTEQRVSTGVLTTQENTRD